jgi:hypothetical protein
MVDTVNFRTFSRSLKIPGGSMSISSDVQASTEGPQSEKKASYDYFPLVVFLSFIFGMVTAVGFAQYQVMTREAQKLQEAGAEKQLKEERERYHAQILVAQREVGGQIIGPGSLDEGMAMNFFVCGRDSLLYQVLVDRYGVGVLEKRKVPMFGKVLQEDGTFLYYPLPHGNTLAPIWCAVDVSMPRGLTSKDP